MALTECKKGSQLIRALHKIQDELEAHLFQFSNTSIALNDIKLDRHDCMEVWADHSSDWLGLEPDKGGRNGADLMFIACCYQFAAQHPEIDFRKIADSVNAKKTILAVRQMGLCIPDDATKDPDQEFQQRMIECTALILYKVANHYTEVVQKARGFQMDFGDPKEEYKGDVSMMATADGEDLMDAKQKQELKELDESERKAEEAMRDARLANGFLPTCSRIFLHSFYEQYLFESFETQPALSVNTGRYVQWVRKRLQVDPPDSFLSRLEAWTYRQLTPIGALWNLRRNPGDQKKLLSFKDLYYKEGIATALPLKKWIDQKPLAILDDAKHPLRDMLHLALYSSMFDCAYTTQLEYRRELKKSEGNFIDNFVVFRDEITAEHAWIHAKEASGMMKRRPLIVQKGRQWVILDKGIQFPAQDMAHALMQWGVLVERDYNSYASYSCDISNWLKQFRVPV